jgi:hypothetical protein
MNTRKVVHYCTYVGLPVGTVCAGVGVLDPSKSAVGWKAEPLAGKPNRWLY